MKILIYGAGVIGTIYGAKLSTAGNAVTLLARGLRYDTLKKDGLVLRDMQTGHETALFLTVTPFLLVTDLYDLIIVTVRLDQIDAIIPILKANVCSPLILFMLNNPTGTTRLSHELADKHILLGFPGVGGTYRNNGIDYLQIRQQKTTIGELNGANSACLQQVKALLERADCKVEVSHEMPAWLKTHAVFITCVSAAILLEDGDSIALGRKRRSVANMVQAIREGYYACKMLGLPIAPKNLNILIMYMPRWFAICYWQHALQGATGTLAIAPHARAAKAEMKLLADKVLSMVHHSSVTTPTLDLLLNSLPGPLTGHART